GNLLPRPRSRWQRTAKRSNTPTRPGLRRAELLHAVQYLEETTQRGPSAMHSATFIGEVQQGQLHIGQPLAEFEGKRVLVTLIALDTPLPPGEPASKLLAAVEAEILATPRARG